MITIIWIFWDVHSNHFFYSFNSLLKYHLFRATFSDHAIYMTYPNDLEKNFFNLFDFYKIDT